MSREDVDVVMRMVAAFESGGLDAVRPLFDEDVVWHEDPSFPEAGVYRGRDAWEAYARQFMAEFAYLHYDVREIVEAGDDLVVNLRLHGEGKSSGAEFDLSAWWALTVRDGRVVRCFAYLDRDRAFEALRAAE